MTALDQRRAAWDAGLAAALDAHLRRAAAPCPYRSGTRGQRYWQRGHRQALHVLERRP